MINNIVTLLLGLLCLATTKKITFKSHSTFRSLVKFQTMQRNKARAAKSGSKFMLRTKSRVRNHLKMRKSGIAAPEDDYYFLQQVLVDIPPGQTLSLDKPLTASPPSLEEELVARVRWEDSLITIDPKDPEHPVVQPDSYRQWWDLRSDGFSCGEDLMEGTLYMVEQIANPSPEQTQTYVQANMTQISLLLQVSQVFVSASAEKVSLRDGGHLLREIIQMDSLYPRLQEMKAALDGDPNGARNRIEALKLKVLNGSVISDDLSHSLDGFYCLLLTNQSPVQDSLETMYRKGLEGDYLDTLQELLANTLQVQKTQASDDHLAYDQLLLCHPVYTVMQKWALYLNRQKLDCNLDFNREHFGMNSSQEIYQYSEETRRANEQSQTIRAEVQRQAEEQRRLQEQEQAEREKKGSTQEAQMKEELERLTSELSDLNESMNQEEAYGSNEISGMMSNISHMQAGVQNKNEQLKCLEKALQIRQEEENTQVVTLLKDEEMSKVKSTISMTKVKMKEAYQSRIKELKANLLKQQSYIQQQQGDYDNLMVNLIKGGMHKGDPSKCFLPQALILDKQKSRAFIEGACSDLLDHQRDDNLEIQDGIMDRVNRCTTKELFCVECCDNQMGMDNLVLREQCRIECQKQMDQLDQDKSVFRVDPTKAIDPEVQAQMIAEVDKQIAIKKKQLAMRFRQRK